MGASGEVYLVQDTKTKKKLALKSVNNDTISITILDHFLQIRKKHMSFAVGEGMTCKYIFNHHTKQWEKSECKKWGL